MVLALLGRWIPLTELKDERKEAKALNGRRTPAYTIRDLAQMIDRPIPGE